jgi:hypothetical protein
VRAKSFLKRACDVRACGTFLSVRSHLCTLFVSKWPEIAIFCQFFVCAHKSGRARCVRTTQKTVRTHPFENS